MKFIDDYLLYLLAQASAALSAEFHDWLASEGVPVGEWRVLASLHPDGAMTVGDLAKTCMVKQPTMTRMIDRMAARSLVIRTTRGGDRRRVMVHLADQGRALAERLVTEAEAHEAKTLARFDADPKDLKDLLRLMATGGNEPGLSVRQDVVGR